MKWFWTPLLVLALSTMVLPACGGRAQLAPDSAKKYRELFRVQANSRPRTPLGKLSARDAKLIMQNHSSTYGSSGKSISRGARRGGSVQPLNLNLGGGQAGGEGPGIKLQAR